jgi:hypothetical protein
VRPVDAAQAVQLVHHHVAQVLEQLHPLRVVGQDPLVQHVRVGDHHVRPRPDRLARVLRSVAVVGERADLGPHGLDHSIELGQLVLGEGLGREEVEGPSVGILQDPVEDRQVVAEGLARRRRRHDHDVAARLDLLVSLPLVRVEPAVAAPDQALAQLRMDPLGKVHDPGRLGREVAERREDRVGPERLLDLQGLEGREERALAVASGGQAGGVGRNQLLAQAGPPVPPPLGPPRFTPA